MLKFLQSLVLAIVPAGKDAMNRVLDVYKAQLIVNIDREVARVVKEIKDPETDTITPDSIKARIVSCLEISGIPSYVKVPLQVIVLTFDLKNYTGNLDQAVTAEVERVKRAINGKRF